MIYDVAERIKFIDQMLEEIRGQLVDDPDFDSAFFIVAKKKMKFSHYYVRGEKDYFEWVGLIEYAKHYMIAHIDEECEPDDGKP